MVDKKLFLYDLAVVAIMKNNALYVKEWLDYHLLAGVDHFYIYDNGSTDNYDEVIKPYVDNGIVTSLKTNTWAMGIPSYMETVKNFKFQCRYMAFIDQDEFIFPKSKSTIAEVVDEVSANRSNFASLGVNWVLFGSNGQEHADYSRGVLDRFSARDSKVNNHIKTVANPRMINFFLNPHYAVYFDGYFSLTEQGVPFFGPFNEARTADKISINHYYTKSKEEYMKKIEAGLKAGWHRDMKSFERHDKNDIEDDGIIKYRDARRAALIPEGKGIEILFPRKQIDYFQLVNALINALFPTQTKGTAFKFYEGQMETFLTCLNLADFLRKKYFEQTAAKFFEEASLQAVYKTLGTGMTLADLMLFIRELPRILLMNYPVVKDIREIIIKIFPQILETFRNSNRWQEFKELEFIFSMLKTADALSIRG